MAQTVVGLFDSFDEARSVRDDLIDAGFGRSDISVLAANSDNRYSDFVDDNVDTSDYDSYSEYTRTTTDHSSDEGEAARDGAIAGGAIGGIGGIILGLGVLAIPGIGPVAAAGPIVAGLIGLITGAISGGLLAALVEAGIDDDDAEVYAEGVRRGYALVTVNSEDDHAQEAANIMNRHGAIDVDERRSSWQTEGWTGYDDNSEAYTADQMTEYRTNRDATMNKRDTKKTTVDTVKAGAKETIEVVEEEMVVGKRKTDEGAARVRTYVTETPVQEQVELRKEHIEVDRHAVDREVDPSTLDAFEEGVVEVTATGEEVVAGKRARVVEEVTIGKGVETVTETVTGSVRRTGVDIDMDIDETITGGRAFADFGNDYQTHYKQTYANTGRSYQEVEPYYEYGYRLGANPEYRDNTDWTTFETTARDDYNRRYADNDSTWDDVKDAVKSGWMSVKNTAR